jgi:hypothetical protein
LRLKLKTKRYTKEEELLIILDQQVFASAMEPDWPFVLRWCAGSPENGNWLVEQICHLLWLQSEDEAAFDEEIWRLTNEAQ